MALSPLGKGHFGEPMPPLVSATHTLLGCTSRGVHLSPAMRLVAVMMLLWGEEWRRLSNGRTGMSADDIADRTSLTTKQVTATLDKMAEVKLVQQHADGWSLTIPEWKKHALGPWMDEANSRTKLRPTRRS